MNIKNIKTYILSGILALSMSSCLDKYPEDSIRMDQAINTVDDMDKLVYGIYDSFKSSALYSGNLTILPDLQADFVYCGICRSLWCYQHCQLPARQRR